MYEKEVEFSLDFTYSEEKSQALNSVKGSIAPGKCIVLCGSSGCGKSTLLRCVNHLIPQFYEGELKGFCKIAGKDLEGLSIGETGRLAASVFQDPRSQFFTLNSDTEVAYGMENAGIPRDKIVSRVGEAFRVFHMEKLRDRNVFSMSSGERQMIAIISAWAMDTELLLLDEPTANLDHASVSQFSQALKILKNRGKTLLISEHRLYYLNDIADEYWFMENGEIKNRYTASQLQKMELSELNALGLRTTDQTKICSVLQDVDTVVHRDRFCIKNLNFRYKNRSEDVIKNVNLESCTGEVVGFVGANGCGKTTLGKLAAGLIKPRAGEFFFNGEKISGKKLINKSIFIMQEAEFQFFTNSVLNEVYYGMDHVEEKKEEIEELLRYTGLWECRNRHPFSLSGGQMQKLVMLTACLSSKPIVVLDEPTAGLDYNSLKVCADLIRRMQKEKIIFLISHDLELLSMVSTRCVSICNGEIDKIFELKKSSEFEQLKDYMENRLRPEGLIRERLVKKEKRYLDPRIKLIILLAAMTAGIGTDHALILLVMLVGMAGALYESKWGILLGTIGSMGLIYSLYAFFPSVATSFIAHFFPRIIVIGVGAALVVSPQEGPRVLAGLRAMHIPEKINMVIAVIFRFFPVLHMDLSIMSQAIKTRGFFSSFLQKIKAAPEYLEIMIVPMVFRVLRIAEALSASAETRGITLKGKRESYTAIKWNLADSCMSLLLILVIVARIFIL